MDLQPATQMHLATGNLIAAFESSAAWIEWGFGIVVIAIAVASINFWYMAIVRLKRKQELIPYQRSECVLGFVDLIAIFVIWLGAQIAVGVILVGLVGTTALGADLLAEHGVLLLYLSAATGIASFVLGGGFLLLRYRTTNSFGLRFNQLRKQITYGIVVFAMLFPPMLLLQWLLSLFVEYEHPVLDALTSDPSFVSIFSCWSAAVLAAPLVEEFLFRGVFQHWLERLSVSKITDNQVLLGGPSISESNRLTAEKKLLDHQSIPTAELVEPNEAVFKGSTTDFSNPYQSPYAKADLPVEPELSAGPKVAYWPILVSSVSFAVVHIGQGLAPIPLFILALGLGYLFRQTGSLIGCITVHFLLNFYSMLVFTTLLLLGETP